MRELWKFLSPSYSLSERPLWEAPYEEFEDIDSVLFVSDRRRVCAQGFAGDVLPPYIKMSLLLNAVAVWKIRPPEIKR